MRSSVLACLVVGLVLLVGGPLVGVVCTVVGMQQAFDALARQGGASSPAELSEGIRQALLYTFLGLPVAGIGLVLLAVALVLHLAARPREQGSQGG